MTETPILAVDRISDEGKYSEAYFKQRIEDLKKLIQLPKICPVVKETFITACQSVQDSTTSLKKSQAVLDILIKKKVDDDTLKTAKEAVDAAQTVVDGANLLAKRTARPALEVIFSAIGSKSPMVDEESLLQCVILIQSTPKGLAEFCDQNPDVNCPLVEQLLSCPTQMKRMVVNGGASCGNYGPALLILDTLDKEMASAYETVPELYRKLALATALELATQIQLFKDTNFIDPISRFWHYVHAYENKELDDAFKFLSIWELRLVVDSNAPDEQLQWGRDYLKAYRPDEVLMPDEQWRYCWAVRSDVGYRHPDADLNTYEDIISNGGECGPRAWFGRFMCKAFGIPTWGVRQPGHAAMSHWTSKGWLICLGAAWKVSSWDERRYSGRNKAHRSGPDFLLETQARAAVEEEAYYQKLCRLECIAEVMGETIMDEVAPDKFWRSLALEQREIYANPTTSSNEEVDIASNPRNCFDHHGAPFPKPLLTGIDVLPIESIRVLSSGGIIIPAASFSSPSKPSRNIIPMPSFLDGGSQLYLDNDGTVEYVLPDGIPKTTYMLSCRMVNVHHPEVPLLLTIETPDDDHSLIDLYSIDVEYTIGAWKTTKPVKIEVRPKSTLKFSREPPCFGLSIKDFTLQPKPHCVQFLS